MNTYIKNIQNYIGQQIGITIVIVFSLFAGSYMVFGHWDEKHDEIETSGGSKYPIVTVIKAKQAYLDTTSFEVNGVVHAKNQSEIYPLKSGNVTQLLAETWDWVKKGQIIARITPERSDARLGSQISLLKKEISLLEERKKLIANNTDAKIDLLSQTNNDKKSLLINNEDRKIKDRADTILPLEAQIESAKVALEIAQKQYESDIESINIQLETAQSQLGSQEASINNSVIDMIDATSNFLYTDFTLLFRTKNYSRQYLRDDFRNSSFQNDIYDLNVRYLKFHEQYRNKTLVWNELTRQALEFAQEVRGLSNTTIVLNPTNGEFENRLNELDEAIDHYGEVQLDNSEVITRVQNLETEKITKKLELEQRQIELDKLIENYQIQIGAQNKGIDINIALEEQTLDSDFKIESAQLRLNTQIEQTDIDTQIENRKAQISALQWQWWWGTIIQAPFDGNITARHVSVWTSVNTSKPLFSMVDESTKFIRFYIWEDQYPFVREWKQISFSSPFAPSESFQVVISRVSKSLSEDTKQILVEADITGRDDLERVITNMNVRVKVPLFSETDNGDDISLYAIPESAIELSKNSSSIWMIDDNLQAKTKNIETDFFFNGTAYIKSGLDGSEWIITATPVPLSEGLEIDTELASNDEK